MDAGGIPAFQVLEEMAFGAIMNLYGQHPMSWTPAAGGDAQTGTVLYNGPTTEREVKMTNGRGLSHIGYINDKVLEPYIEYMVMADGIFQGLFESVYAGGDEYVNITLKDGTTAKYICKGDETAKFDGQTFRIPISLSEI
jgi:hypothetical protein